MSNYWAKFKKVDDDTFRFDTRIYLIKISEPSDDYICIGAVVGKNPGSAIAMSAEKIAVATSALRTSEVPPADCA